jgi:tetratricopeptide (TPR) repeat protein
MSEENSLGSIIKNARDRMGWTQQEVATKFDPPVSRATVIRWEKDGQHPSDFNIKQLISILGLNEKEADALNRAAGQPTLRRRHLPSRNLLFTGREKQLEQVRQLLKENHSVALSGLAGIGKTQLALEYAHSSYPDIYRVVFWVDAADRRMLEAGYDKMLQKLGLPEQHKRDQALRKKAVKDWLEDHTNWLLIMDNADDLLLASSFFPSAHDGHILLTTRTQIIGHIARKLEIEKMEPEEGQLFLLRRSDRSEGKATLDTFAEDTRESALKVVELLDGHPLAIDYAGAYIEGGVSFTDYIDHYHRQRRRFLDEYGPLDGEHSDYPESVVVTFKLCFEKAREQHALATDILRFCAFLHPVAMPYELFQHDDSFKLDWTAFTRGIAALLRYSMIIWNKQEKTFSMHRLVQDVLIDGMSSDLRKQWRERVVQALIAAFPHKVDFKDWVRCERLLSHVRLCTAWEEDEAISTVEAATLFHRAGVYLNERGQYSEAITLLARAFSIYEQQFGVEHPETAAALHDLAVISKNTGMRELRESLYLFALNIMEKQFGAEHPHTVTILSNLVALYLEQDNTGLAKSFLKRALSSRRKLLGTEHPDTAKSIFQLAIFYHRQGNYVKAELLYQRALKIFEKYLGTEHPDTAFTLHKLAHLRHEQGQYEQAAALNQRYLNCLEQQLGATHPEIIKRKRAHAEYLHSIGRDAEAAALEASDEPSK